MTLTMTPATAADEPARHEESLEDHLTRLLWTRFPDSYDRCTNVASKRNAIEAEARALIAADIAPEVALDEAEVSFNRSHVDVCNWSVPTHGRVVPADFGSLCAHAIAAYLLTSAEGDDLDPDDVTVAAVPGSGGPWLMIEKRTGQPLQDIVRATFVIPDLLKFRTRRSDPAVTRVSR